MERVSPHYPSSPVERVSTTASETRDQSLYTADVVLIAGAAVLFTLPVLIHGPMVGGHDTYEQLNFTQHFTEQFWQGDLYPRWLLKMNHGLGSPTFFVYPPLPSFVSALLQPVARAMHFSAFRVMEYLAIFGSGFAALLWIRSLATRRIALAVSIIYMLIPYHLIADFYRRTALPECWALVWIPLILYFTSKSIRRERGALAGLALCYALMIISHLISVLIFSMIPLASAVVYSPRREKVQNALHVALVMLLGAGLAAFYLVPALAHSRNFPIDRMISVYPYLLTDNFIEFGKKLFSGGDFIRTISLIVINMILLLLVCAALAFRNEHNAARRTILFWLSVSTPAVFMMTRWSLPVWEAFPILHRLIQFPWRLNVVLCVATLPILAAFLSDMSHRRCFTGATNVVSLTVVSLILVSWLGSYAMVWRRYRAETQPVSTSVSEDDGWFNSWSVPGIDQNSALEASSGPPVRFITGSGTAEVLLWKPRHLELQTSSPTGGLVVIDQFYYPAWQARGVGGTPVELKPAMPQGLLGMYVAPGHEQQVRLDIPVGKAEIVGRVLSVASALVWGILFWVGKGSSVGSYAVPRATAAAA